MRLSCPACNAETSLEVLVAREADARAVAAFLERSLPLGEALVRYIALFRPAKRRLGLARMVALIEEIMPDIERHAIDRKGREWRAEPRAWRHAFETVLAARDKGTLSLPLTSHGYLYEVLCALAEKAEAAVESQREAERRTHRAAGPRTGTPRDLAEMAASIAHGPDPITGPAPVPQQGAAGPSRAALEIQARIKAGRSRMGGPAESIGQPTGDANTGADA